jgi:CheY-like chemotaxis protein
MSETELDQIRRPRQPLRFLVVDDDKPIRDLLVRQLLLDGHSAESVPTSIGALQKMVGGRFDVLVTDKNMPYMNRLELATVVKRKWPATFVVLVTACGQNEVRALRDVDVFLGKPVSRGQLNTAIAHARGLS